MDVRTLPIDGVGFLRQRHRLALPVLAPSFAAATIDADIVLCSSSGWAHGVRTTGRKIVYCHSPAKWLYRRGDYLGNRPSRLSNVGLGAMAPMLAAFDRAGARSADRYVANSSYIADQIRALYGIEAEVLCPPPGLDPDGPTAPVAGAEPGFLLTVARLLPYKNVEATVAALSILPNTRLVVVGAGPLLERLSATAAPNVTFLGETSDEQLRWLYANCSGLVASSREDFGLTPLEAATFGKPVAALGFGGHLDTVDETVNGILFEQAEPLHIAAAIERLSARSWDADAIRVHAERFSEARFAERVQGIVEEERALATTGNPVDTAARQLIVEHETVRTLGVLHDAGIRAILLKGPAMQAWLAPAGAPRPSNDIDLLVHPEDADRAGAALATTGLALQLEVTPGVERHGDLWSAPGRVPVEVHWTISGADVATTWDVLARESETAVLLGRPVEVPNEAARCLVVALHAAQHGTDLPGPLYDLDRAADIASTETWGRASAIAAEIGAEAAFVTGLGLREAGVRVRETLGLRPAPLTEMLALNLAGPVDGAAGFLWLARQPGLRGKAAFALHKLVPPPAFMRTKYAYADRRGQAGLAVAYVHRLAWIARSTLPGYLAWRRTRRIARHGAAPPV